jgi:hypothetical protein
VTERLDPVTYREDHMRRDEGSRCERPRRRGRWLLTVSMLVTELGCGSSARNPDVLQPPTPAAAGTGGMASTSDGRIGDGGRDGSMTVVIECSGCLIDGRCYASGDHDPGNPCAFCKPETDAASWSDEADGTACDDRSGCSANDRCQTGLCVGSPKDCSDGRACTSGEHCDPLLGCVAGESTCPAGESCLPSGECGSCSAEECTILSTCFPALEPNAANPCEICDPARSTNTWSILPDGSACSDGLACTGADVCANGQCTGGALSCDDGIFCNGVESCVEDDGACVRAGGTSPCASGCAESQAVCSRVVPECTGRVAGTRFCSAGTLYACGPDGVAVDLQTVTVCEIECQGDIGDARCAAGDDTVELDQVWPASNVRGGALLIAGKNVANATEVWFDGFRAPIISRDTSVPGSQKVITQVPEAASNIEGKLRLVTPDGISESLGYIVEQGQIQPGPRGPLSPVGGPQLAPSPEPEPPPTYPPVSDFWVNECDVDDIYFLSEESPEDQTSTIRPFTQVLSDTPDKEAITGFIDMQTLLVHMTVTSDGASRSYIGIYSDTGAEGIFRLLLFPENAPGRQLVLSVSESGDPIPDSLPSEQCSR